MFIPPTFAVGAALPFRQRAFLTPFSVSLVVRRAGLRGRLCSCVFFLLFDQHPTFFSLARPAALPTGLGRFLRFRLRVPSLLDPLFTESLFFGLFDRWAPFCAGSGASTAGWASYSVLDDHYQALVRVPSFSSFPLLRTRRPIVWLFSFPLVFIRLDFHK